MIIRLVGDTWVTADNIVCSVVDNDNVSKALVSIMKKLKITKLAEYTMYKCNGAKCDYSNPLSHDASWKAQGIAQGSVVYVTKKAPPETSAAGSIEKESVAGDVEMQGSSPPAPPRPLVPTDMQGTSAPPPPPRPIARPQVSESAGEPASAPPPPPARPHIGEAEPSRLSSIYRTPGADRSVHATPDADRAVAMRPASGDGEQRADVTSPPDNAKVSAANVLERLAESMNTLSSRLAAVASPPEAHRFLAHQRSGLVGGSDRASSAVALLEYTQLQSAAIRERRLRMEQSNVRQLTASGERLRGGGGFLYHLR